MEEPYTYEFFGQIIVAHMPIKRNLIEKIRWLFTDIRMGIESGYPSCCIWYYTKHSWLGVPVAAYDYVIKGKRKNDCQYVLCDKCYKKKYL